MLVNVERIQPQRDPVLGRVIVGERVFPGEKAPRGGLQVGLRLRRHTAREANALGRGNQRRRTPSDLPARWRGRPTGGSPRTRAGLINTANHRWCRAHHGKNNSRTISTFSGLAEIAAHTSNTVAVHHVDDSRAFADPGTVERCRQSLQGPRSFVRPANQKNHPFPNTPRPLTNNPNRTTH